MQPELVPNDILPVACGSPPGGWWCGPQFLLGMAMKTNTASLLASKGILLQVLAYLLWLVSVVVCVAAIVQLRSAVNVLWVALRGDRYSLGLVNQLCLILGGLAAFVYILFLEYYYRSTAKLTLGVS
jgi:hypothetical protein